MAAAAVGRQVAENCARLRISRRDAGSRGRPRRRRARQAPPVQQPAQGDHVRLQRLAVDGARVTVIGQLQRRETQHLHSPSHVAGTAVHLGRNAMPLSRRHLNRSGHSVGRHEFSISLLVVPRVGGERPFTIAFPQHPRFNFAAAERELLPELRAVRKLPVIGIRRVDRLVRRQIHPPPLLRTITPQRILRRKRSNPGPQARL